MNRCEGIPMAVSERVLAKIGRRVLVALLLIGPALMLVVPSPVRTFIILRLNGMKTVSQRVDEFGPIVRERLAPEFRRIGVAYPPKSVVLVGLKQERRLEVWVSDGQTGPRLLKSYPILGASGGLGPKLREGDRQVPEGLYRIESLNPNSLFHLSLRVDYPNADDQRWAKADGRQNLGGDIMIHGSTSSVGCLAMGDPASEDLFVLAAESGERNVRVVLSPVDFRIRDLPSDMPDAPAWTEGLYAAIRGELTQLQQP